MSIRSDSGVCNYCGAVMLVAQMNKLDDLKPAYDSYACPECWTALKEEARGAAEQQAGGPAGQGPGAGGGQ